MKGAKRDHSKILIVEGEDDRYTVIGLLEHYIQWPNKPPYPVWVEVSRSVSEILNRAYLPTEIKSNEIICVLLDADELAADRRYRQVLGLLQALFPTMPAVLPSAGLIVNNEDGKRFGVWVMPDNKASGDLETFLKLLVPSENGRLWEHACSSVKEAVNLGSGCRDKHQPKANLYTWLAWQDPPGQSPGRALTQKILDPKSPHAAGFIEWFKQLYRL